VAGGDRRRRRGGNDQGPRGGRVPRVTAFGEAVGARLLDLLDRRQACGQVVVLAVDDLQWADRQSSRAVLFALRRLAFIRATLATAERDGPYRSAKKLFNAVRKKGTS
jgi:hypothetical protein